MKNALILQGWYQKPASNWYPWLKKELEAKDFNVLLPDLPTVHTDLPDWKKIEAAIIKLDVINDQTLIIGHSLGCLMALRLAQKHTFRKMILVSGWDFNDLTQEHQLFWQSPLDHPKIKQNVKDIVCVSSDNDPYFTYFTNEQMSQRLGAKSVKVIGAGHFTDKFGISELPQILEDL